MQASSANNMGHNFPLLQFPMTVPSPSPQIHHNSRQQNNFTGNYQANQPLSPSFPTASMPSPSMYHRMEKETKLIAIKLFFKKNLVVNISKYI